MKRYFIHRTTVFCLILLLPVFLFGCAVTSEQWSIPVQHPDIGMLENHTIILDAGHGGFDGGAIGKTTGVREDVLNLQVVQKLQTLLEQAGAEVLLTRKDDQGLNNPTSSSSRWKREDMNARYRLIKDSQADLVLSVHMNKFTQSSVYGAQVFYQKGDEQSAAFANTLQSMLHTLPQAGKRMVKYGDYMVLKAGLPVSALVECGFLSNPNDEAILQDEDYQYQLAWCMYAAITAHFQLS